MKNLNKNLQVGLLFTIGFLIIAGGSCKKTESTLTPTKDLEPNYILPQGNNDYDQRITDYFNRWGTYVLYKFSSKDINWQVSTNDNYYKSVPAVETYINPQLDLLESTFFKYYSDSTLKKYLPVKLFLCSSLKANTTEVNAYLTILGNTNQGGFQSFAVNGANSDVSTINKAAYRADINFSFLRKMDLDYKMTQSITFIGLSDYVTAIMGTQADRYKRGLLGTTTGISTPTADWHSYISAIVSNPYSVLIDPATTATDATAKGILSSVKDVNGLVRKKYDAITAHYKTRYNIDLQTIGNGL